MYKFMNIKKLSQLTVFVVAVILAGVSIQSTAHAGGAVGGGGSGGDGSGGHQSKYGYGWYVYDLSSSGPSNGFRNGMPWRDVVSACQGSSTQVAVFIVLNAAGDAKGYNYEGWTNLKKGGNYLTLEGAKGAYDLLDPSLKTGFTWGVNVGWFCYGPLPTNWDAAGSSAVDRSTATIGQTVNFTHNLRSVGNRDIVDSDNLEWRTVGYRISGGVKGAEFNVASGRQSSLGAGPGVNVSTQNLTFDSSMGLKAGDIVCRYITFPDRQSMRDPWEKSVPACVTITSSYDLYPNVSISASIMRPDTEQAVTENIINASSMVPDRSSPYAVYEFAIKRGQSKPTADDLNATFQNKSVGAFQVKYTEASIATTACDWVKSSARGFSNMANGCKILSNGNKIFDQTNNVIDDPPIFANDYSIGDLVCRIISVGNFSHTTTDSSSRRISMPACITIAKSPHVQIWGNDVRVGDSIYTSGSTNGPRDEASVYTSSAHISGVVYGSWAEYGIFAPISGRISSVSGGAISLAPNAKALSFANTTNQPGYWSPAKTIPSILSKLADVPVGKTMGSGTINMHEDLNGSLPDGKWYKVVVNGNTRIQGNAYPANMGTVIIEVKGTARIERDIVKNTGVAYTELGNAANIIIVARNIIVNADVKQVNAWLVAIPSTDSSNDGVISTCDAIATPYYRNLIVSGPCNQNQLTINGAVMAKELQLRRTHGAERPDLGKPAEIINLRADAYMWGSGAAGSDSGTGYPIRTIQTRELPPRF